MKMGKTDVLDKIRTEIKIKHDRAKALNMVLQMNAYTDCLQIIDKYRTVDIDEAKCQSCKHFCHVKPFKGCSIKECNYER